MSKQDMAVGHQPHIVLYGLFGFGNTGNDATLKIALEAFQSLRPDARFTVVAQEPMVVEATHHVTSVAIRPESHKASSLPRPVASLLREFDRWKQARAVLRSADCMIVPGTGILDDFGCSVMQHPYQMWKWCNAARRSGAALKFVSIGAGPVKRAWSRRLFRWSARMADHRSYRDETSRTFVRDELGLDTKHDVVTPDLVFGLEAPIPELREGGVRTVGIGVMDYHTWSGAKNIEGDIYETYMSKLASFCGDLLEQGLALHLLVGEPGDDPAAADLRTRLIERAPQSRDAITIGSIRTLEDLCVEIGKTDVVVATRYHNIVSAMICGRPAISLGYAEKNRAVMGEFGLKHYCQDIGDFDVKILRDQFESLVADHHAKAKGMRDTGDRLKRIVREHLATVMSEIASG